MILLIDSLKKLFAPDKETSLKEEDNNDQLEEIRNCMAEMKGWAKKENGVK